VVVSSFAARGLSVSSFPKICEVSFLLLLTEEVDWIRALSSLVLPRCQMKMERCMLLPSGGGRGKVSLLLP